MFWKSRIYGSRQNKNSSSVQQRLAHINLIIIIKYVNPEQTKPKLLFSVPFSAVKNCVEMDLLGFQPLVIFWKRALHETFAPFAR